MLQSMGSQRVGHDWATEQQQQRWEPEKRLCGRGTWRESQVRHDVCLWFSTYQGETTSPVGLVIVVCWALPQSFWICRLGWYASFVLLSVQMMQMLLGWWPPPLWASLTYVATTHSPGDFICRTWGKKDPENILGTWALILNKRRQVPRSPVEVWKPSGLPGHEDDRDRVKFYHRESGQ